jgi:hypothetical protein
MALVRLIVAAPLGERRKVREGWAIAWTAELERRMQQIERGEVKLLTREQFFAATDDERR